MINRVCAAGGLLVWDHIAVLETEFRKNNVEVRQGFHKQFSTCYPGGCIGNIAMAMKRLGLQVDLSCLAGGKDLDSNVLESLTKQYETLEKLVWNDKRDFCHCYQIYDALHNKISIMDELLEAESVDAYAINEGKMPLICLALPEDNKQTPSLIKLIERTRKNGYPVALSMISSPGIYVERMLESADYIFMNAHEADTILRQYCRKDSMGFLLERGVSAIFVTDGANGCRVFEKANPEGWCIPAVKPTRISDTTGAGDGFAGGTMAGLLAGFSYGISAKIGAVVSSFVLEEIGAQTGQPGWNTMEERYHAQFGAMR